MSLNWNLQSAPEKDYCLDDANWPVTQTIIFATMAVDMGEISESNWKEFYRRVHFLERLNGPWMGNAENKRFLTPEDVYRRVGLRTNVADRTWNQFVKRHTNVFSKEALGAAERYAAAKV